MAKETLYHDSSKFEVLLFDNESLNIGKMNVTAPYSNLTSNSRENNEIVFDYNNSILNKFNKKISDKIDTNRGFNFEIFINYSEEKPKDVLYSKTIKHYFEKIANEFTEIVLDDNIMAGVPTITGRRITVSHILAEIHDILTQEQIECIADDYDLDKQVVSKVVQFTKKVLDGLQME